LEPGIVSERYVVFFEHTSPVVVSFLTNVNVAVLVANVGLRCRVIVWNVSIPMRYVLPNLE
jgi:hypothetical protein